eukprot:jgi/Botrbrau1/7274/Bobra.0318s0012.1
MRAGPRAVRPASSASADEIDPYSGVAITSLSVCQMADKIASSGVPICFLAGWMDSTASASIHAFANSPPGSELVIGPWSHAGFLDNRAGPL